MNKLKIALASFLIVNSFTMAETLTDFQKKAVKDLYSKGILQTIVKEEDFEKKDNFSRGEIATIIYNTVNYKNSDALKSASEKDIIVLKALISDFSSELAKLGAADYELIQLINEEKNIVNKRIDKEVLTLNDKIDRIKLSGDVTLVKEFDTSKTNPEFFSEMKGEGEVRLDIKISEEIKAKASYDFDRGMGEYALEVKNPTFNLSIFNDESLSNEDWKDLENKNRRNNKDIVNKKIPNFSNAIGLIDKSGINNLDTIVLNKKMPTKDFTALATSTENEDIYGFEYKSKMPYFMTTPGSDANMLISQVFLDDKDDLDNSNKTTKIHDRRFLILGADFFFPINGNANQSLIYNYSKMRQNSQDTVAPGTKYFFPVVDDEATLVDAKTDINSNKYGKIELTLSGLNTGANYDPTGLSDSEREVFAKTDKVKLAQDIFGGVLELKNTKGSFENTFSSITYKKNDDSEIDTTSKIGTLYSLKDGKTKVGLAFGQNSDKEDSSSTKYTRNFVELELQLKDKIKNDAKEVMKVNLAKEKVTDKDELTVYGEHKETRKNGNITLAAEYKDTAVENTVKTAFVHEKADKISEKYEANILVGGKYEKDLESKKENYAAFTKFDVELKENISLDGGLRYSKGRTSNNGTTYAAGINYNLSKDFKISAIYGPVNVLDNYSKDIFDYKTDGIYGDDKQNIGSLKVSVKF